MNTLAELADDLRRASAQIGSVSGEIVHGVASGMEAQVRAFDGTPSRVVVNYPDEGSATLRGTETFGVTQMSSPLSATEALDVPAAAARISHELADAGLALVMGR